MFPLMGPVQGGEDFMGFVHPGSAMFNRQNSSNDLRRTHTSAPSDDTQWTASMWFRIGEIGALSINRTLTAADETSFNGRIQLDTSYRLVVAGRNAAWNRTTTRVFRDPTAWYHLCVIFDADISGDDAIQVYVNGERETAFDVNTNGTLGQTFSSNWLQNGQVHFVGNNQSGAPLPWEGFIAGIHIMDGQKYGPLNFGLFHPAHGEWIPRQVSGLDYGNNGFHLDFADPSDLGNDVSGNNNDFTAQGTFGAANSFVDVPANTFPMWNSVDYNNTLDFTNAGSTVSETSATGANAVASFPIPATGKWYWEYYIEAASSNTPSIGVMINPESSNNRGNVQLGVSGALANGISYDADGDMHAEGTTNAAWGNSYTASDVVGVAFDADTGEIWFSKNNTWQGSGSPDPATGTSPAATITTYNAHPYPAKPTVVPAGTFVNSSRVTLNAGTRGGLNYTPPTGFKSFSTKNFPALFGPALQPEKFFDILQYEGDGASSRTLTGLKFQPDVVQIKGLDNTQSWRMAINMADFSPSPSTPNNMRTNGQEVPTDFTDGNIEGFNSDGFDVADGSVNGAAVNASGVTYQAWCWKSDPAAGFEIIRYQGTGVARTVAHNLGKTPEMVMVKRLSGANGSWVIYSSNYGSADPETDFYLWNSNAAGVDDATVWNDTAPTETDFTVGTNVALNANGSEYVAFVFTSISGFLKFAAMEGNSNANGALVPTDFAPRFVLTKNINAISSNLVVDPVLAGEDNQVDSSILWDQTSALGSVGNSDFLANGWKARANNTINVNNNFHQKLIYGKAASKFARAR